MPDLILSGLIFIVSLGVLVKASDLFTDAAERIGILMGLPAFVVGVTIVSLGTSLPELISSIVAVTQGAPEVVISNVVGSNIANICLVLGLASIASTNGLQITYDLVSVDLPLFVGSALLLMLMAWDQDFSKGEAVLLLLGYGVYLFYILKSSQAETTLEALGGAPSAISEISETAGEAGLESRDASEPSNRTYSLGQWGLLILSALLIFLGARYTIESLIQISQTLGIGTEIIAVSAVALGTSLPELMVTANAARKNQAELAVGNVLGSNIFNIFTVMGIPGLLGTLTIPAGIMATGIPTMISATLLMFFAIQDKKLTVWEGWLFLILYGWFIGHTFNWI
ncbi:conjugal transfer protein TraR [filamentous cyanobacterium CCP5]|nr:conjugal transfer protein TraR [filamentous cyanobacterium CCT1]PSN17499.1 conjugal transfer protein TraR [filamentous cyanobacterium CCP5]